MNETVTYRPPDILGLKDKASFLLAFPATGSKLTVEELMTIRAKAKNEQEIVFQIAGNLPGVDASWVYMRIRDWADIINKNPDGWSSTALETASVQTAQKRDTSTSRLIGEYYTNTCSYLELLSKNPSLLALINKAIDVSPQGTDKAHRHYGLVNFLAETYGWPKGNLDKPDNVPTVRSPMELAQTANRPVQHMSIVRAAALNILKQLTSGNFIGSLPRADKPEETIPTYQKIFGLFLGRWKRYERLKVIDEKQLAQLMSSPLFIMDQNVIKPETIAYHQMKAVHEETRIRFESILVWIIQEMKSGVTEEELKLALKDSFPHLRGMDASTIYNFIYTQKPRSRKGGGNLERDLLSLSGMNVSDQLIAQVIIENPDCPNPRQSITEELLTRFQQGESQNEACKFMGLNTVLVSDAIRCALIDILLNGQTEDIYELSQLHKYATSSPARNKEGDPTIKSLRGGQSDKLRKGAEGMGGLYSIWKKVVTRTENQRKALDDFIIDGVAKGESLKTVKDNVIETIATKWGATDLVDIPGLYISADILHGAQQLIFGLAARKGIQKNPYPNILE